MNIMSLDAEYNQPSKKTIQIGAAVFNVKTGELIESIEMFVNPNEPIDPEITELTGIKDSDVANGVSILEAYREIERLHKKHKCFRNPLVWGTGTSNDSDHIYKETGLTEDVEENFMGLRVLDVKTIYQSVQLYRNKQFGGGLKQVCEERLKIGFQGEAHRALTDAINTFRVWYHLIKVFNENKN